MTNENYHILASSKVLDEVEPTSHQNLIDRISEKVKNIDAQQIKVLFGIGYFLALMVLSFSLILG